MRHPRFPLGLLLAAALLGASPARADLAPPDYRAYHGQRAYAESLLALRTGHTERALQAAQRATELRPEDADSLYLLGVCHLFAGELEAAQTALLTLIEREPDLVEAHHDLGLVWLTMGDGPQATLAFTRVEALRPESWIGPYRLAQVAGLLDGDLGACERHLRRAVDAGYPYAASLPVDADWAKLAEDPAFLEMFGRIVGE